MKAKGEQMDYWTRHAKNCNCGCNNIWLNLGEDTKTQVSILGGFLGAGKTTTLNCILSQSADRRVEVIVKEFGSIGVDNKLLNIGKEHIHPFTGASLHVDQQTMLTNFIESLYAKSLSDPFDNLIIETSGADNAEAIAQIFYLPRSRDHYELGSYICIVDGEFGRLNMHEFRVAREQVAMADYLVINKCDLASCGEIELLEKELMIINPFAEIIRTSFGSVNAEALWRTDSYKQLKSMDFDRRGNEQMEDFKSVSVRIAEPLDKDKVNEWLKEFYALWGQKLLRGKGYFNISGSDYRFDFQSVRTNFHAKTEALWETDAERESVLVFIGTEIPDREYLLGGLLECKASGACNPKNPEAN